MMADEVMTIGASRPVNEYPGARSASGTRVVKSRPRPCAFSTMRQVAVSQLG